MKKGFLLLFMFVFVSLACSLSQTAPSRTNGAAVLKGAVFPTLTQTATKATSTADPVRCVVVTGLQNGRVNLRSGAGVGFGVSAVLTEGQPLTILQAGAWSQVRTGAGVTGYLNSKFCK